MSASTDCSCGSSGPNSPRLRAGCLDATRTENSCWRRCMTTRRPRKPVPPKTVTRRMVMLRTTARSRLANSRAGFAGGPNRAIEYAVDLARHDEVVLVQALDLLGVEGDGRVTPAEADVGVMAFGLRQLTDFPDKAERLPKIAASKRALDAVGVIAQFPIGSLGLEALGFITREWRNAAATRRASLLGKSFAHGLVPKTTFTINGDGGRALNGAWFRCLSTASTRRKFRISADWSTYRRPTTLRYSRMS